MSPWFEQLTLSRWLHPPSAFGWAVCHFHEILACSGLFFHESWLDWVAGIQLQLWWAVAFRGGPSHAQSPAAHRYHQLQPHHVRTPVVGEFCKSYCLLCCIKPCQAWVCGGAHFTPPLVLVEPWLPKERSQCLPVHVNSASWWMWTQVHSSGACCWCWYTVKHAW